MAEIVVSGERPEAHLRQAVCRRSPLFTGQLGHDLRPVPFTGSSARLEGPRRTENRGTGQTATGVSRLPFGNKLVRSQKSEDDRRF